MQNFLRFILCVLVFCLGVHMYKRVPATGGNQKKALQPQELELEVVVSFIWVLGLNPGPLK